MNQLHDYGRDLEREIQNGEAGRGELLMQFPALFQIEPDSLALKRPSAKIRAVGFSPLISKLHTNWRLEAIKSLDRYTEKDLHYSAAITASHKDVAVMREMLVNTIDEFRKIVRPSANEACFVYCFDLFQFGG